MSVMLDIKRTAQAVSLPVGVSLYLDIVRFSAAMAVFLGHAAGRYFTGGLFWQIAPYMQTAVIVFFVLSGFVISYVLSGREHDLFSFSKQRIARLYSVAIPALLLTGVTDAIGISINPDLYYNGPWGYPVDSQAVRYVLTFFFLNHTWWMPDMSPGINGPFWSLCFEAFYYVFIAVVFFSSGVIRVAMLCCLGLAAGPSIIALLPAWCLGFWLYRFATKHPLGPVAAPVAAAVGLGLLLSSPVIRDLAPNFAAKLTLRDCIGGDYIDALAFALHLYGVMSWHAWLARSLRPVAGLIRYLGSLTFALYLFHRPLIQLFAAIPLGAPSTLVQRTYVLAGTLLIVATIGWRCERLKFSIGAALDRLRCQWKGIPAPLNRL